MAELLRERLYAFALGFSRQDGADRLAHDPAFRTAVWDRPGCEAADERLASQPTSSRLVSLLAGWHNARNSASSSTNPFSACGRGTAGRRAPIMPRCMMTATERVWSGASTRIAPGASGVVHDPIGRRDFPDQRRGRTQTELRHRAHSAPTDTVSASEVVIAHSVGKMQCEAKFVVKAFKDRSL
ncbi:MAG: transposase [Planctomycetota bacterium]|nr:transposase [Planctomycetota bacterium]